MFIKILTRKSKLFIPVLIAIFMLIAGNIAYAEYKLSEKQYIDPKGYFKIIPPAGWEPEEFLNDHRGKVKFVRSLPSGIMLQVIAQASPFNSLQELKEDAEGAASRMEQKYGASTGTEKISFAGIAAIKFSVEIPQKIKQLQIQFILNGIHYTIVYGTPPSNYNEFYHIAMASFETFEPILKKIGKEDAKKHIIASKIRTAKNLIQLGQNDYALIVINEGLSLDSNNGELLKLKKVYSKSIK